MDALDPSHDLLSLHMESKARAHCATIQHGGAVPAEEHAQGHQQGCHQEGSRPSGCSGAILRLLWGALFCSLPCASLKVLSDSPGQAQRVTQLILTHGE